MTILQDAPLRFEELPNTFNGLTGLHALRPIHDDAELAAATQVIDALAGHDLNPDQADYLDSLSTLVEAYEEEHHPVASTLRGLEALRALLDEHEMSAADLARLVGGHRSLGAKILRGERSLTAAHLKKLSEHFAVSVDLLIP